MIKGFRKLFCFRAVRMPLLLLHQPRIDLGEAEALSRPRQRHRVLRPQRDFGLQGERGRQDVQLDVLPGQQSRYVQVTY